ncbi:hypothetical protein AMTRI_Chr01g137080 [Amborella trichopoda]
MNPESTISAYARAFPRSDTLYWNPDTMRNEEGIARVFPRSDMLYPTPGTLVQENRICLATWNVGTLTDKSTKLKGYNRNGVGIIVDKDLKDKVNNVKRLLLIKLVLWKKITNVIIINVKRLLLIKLVLGKKIINVISAYIQVGLDDRIKRQFWEDIDGIRNEMYETILDFDMANDLAITNTLKSKYLITYKSGSRKSLIDLFLVKKVNRPLYKDFKVISGESLTIQHMLMVMDVVEFKK